MGFSQFEAHKTLDYAIDINLFPRLIAAIYQIIIIQASTS